MENSVILTVEDVNRLNALEYTPAIVLMTLVVIFGLTGNAFASIFYIWKSQKSVIHFFISILSINDTVTNLVFVHEIVQMFFYLSCNNIFVCKLFIVLKQWLVGNSLLFMLAIALDRYRRVCFPFSKQITYPFARGIILGLACFSFLIASRNIGTVEIFEFNITAGNNTTLPGYYCTQSKKKEMENIKTIFHVMDICVHAVIMCSFVVLNVLLLRKIVKTKQKLKDHGPVVSFNMGQLQSEASGETSSTDMTHINLDLKHDAALTINRSSEKTRNGNVKENNKPELRKMPSTLKENRKSLRRTLSHVTASRMEIKITTMIVVITVISALCFVPYYVAMLTVKQDFSGNAKIMTVTEILARRSYILNSAVNPYIMLVFNLPFRHFVFNTACRLCLRYKNLQ